MHTYNEANTHELILAHQHRVQLYEQAKRNADSGFLHNEYDRKRYLDELFSHRVIAQLSEVKAELASHGYGSELEIKTEQLEHNNMVVDVIYEVVFTFNGTPVNDPPISSDDSQMVFFTQSGSTYLACRYKTALVSSQIQALYFDDEGYSHFLAQVGSKTLWHEHTHSHSELSSLISDFIALNFIQKRANLSRI
ncbi:hypothetical protein PA25_27620 [Pseudoalteromonas sp. A25]|uniref:hypothetical protein n=1 Tax=Pseudoalteromonas sp. A25 TaxID=116092 RepID=UPI001260EF29|nr:hypothetical protein [Pseudoalteromonas sp. A25]BBN82777.1 hypothetical protein PA25_27620 [Pseudoalteromonas sp. A25]